MHRRLLVLVPLALAAGCGGGSSLQVAETARPCLERLGTYVHHTPQILPVPDPASHVNPPAHLSNPKGFQEYGEVGFPSGGKGANAVQVLIFGDAKQARQVYARMERQAPTPGPFGYPPIERVEYAHEVTLLIWSSEPTAAQDTAVEGCVNT